MKIEKKEFVQVYLKDLLSYFLLFMNGFIGITVINYAAFYEKYSKMLICLMIMWGINLIFCLLEIRKRIVAFIFHLMLFLFLISRIFIPELQGTKWWNSYSVKANVFAIKAIAFSMISICAGVAVFEIAFIIFQQMRRSKVEENQKTSSFIQRKTMLQVLRFIVATCMICFFVKEVDKLLFMRGRAYEEYFSLYQSRIPFFISFPAGCMPFFLYMLLALKPNKRESFIWLALNVILTLPMLKIGVRNPFILSCMFAFVYYFFRDSNSEKAEKKWIGKFEKGLIIAVIPAMILFMGAYNYIRDSKSVNLSVGDLVVDFVYKQGTTYDTVLQGYVNEKKLLGSEKINYTFGAVSDAFYYNSLGRRIFSLDDIGSGNSLKMAYNSHTFSHAISYIVLGKDYISGNGRGSSYIIENYIDWKYPGVVGFSLFLGMICSGMALLFGKKWLGSVIILSLLMDIFFTPRAESLAFATFLVSYKFWMCVVGTICIAFIWEKIEYKRKWKK